MQNRYEYILCPSTIISLITGLIAFFTSYKLLQSRVEHLEKELKNIDADGIKITLSQIQTDLAWIKQAISSKKK